jgi:hypothetical protein
MCQSVVNHNSVKKFSNQTTKTLIKGYALVMILNGNVKPLETNESENQGVLSI